MCHGYMLSLSSGETFFVHGVVNRFESDIFSGSVFFHCKLRQMNTTCWVSLST